MRSISKQVSVQKPECTVRRVYAVVCGGQQNQEEGQCRWGIPEGGRSAGAPCPHTQDGILHDLNFHSRWTVRIYDLVTAKECHVLHLRSGEATDVSIYTKLNVDPCTEKFTPCQWPLCSFQSGRNSLSVSASLNPALHTSPGLGAVRLYVLVVPTSFSAS